MLWVIRAFLGLTFVTYGVIKVLGGQFNYGDWAMDSRTADGPTLVWAFYGWSAVYGRLIGLAEVLAGVLVLVPRTRTVGALLLFPITANITVMDFCFAFPPVKYFSLLLTVLTGVLLAADAGRLHAAMRAVLGPPAAPVPGRRNRPLTAALVVVVALPLLLYALNLVAVATGPDPVRAAADRCSRDGWDRERLELRSWRLSDSWHGIDQHGVVEFAVKGAGPDRLLRVDVSRPHGFAAWRAGDCAGADGRNE